MSKFDHAVCLTVLVLLSSACGSSPSGASPSSSGTGAPAFDPATDPTGGDAGGDAATSEDVSLPGDEVSPSGDAGTVEDARMEDTGGLAHESGVSSSAGADAGASSDVASKLDSGSSTDTGTNKGSGVAVDAGGANGADASKGTAVAPSGTSQPSEWTDGSFRALPSMRGSLAGFVGALPHPASGYASFDATRAARFRVLVETLISTIDASVAGGGDFCSVPSVAKAAGYSIRRFYDTDSGRWFVYGSDETGAGQAYFFINPFAKRDLVIEAPHEPIDAGTGLEGARVFTDLAARALIVNNAHRCTSPAASACDGTTTACGGGNRSYPTSDLAHDTNNALHVMHAAFSDADASTKFVQLHGMAGSATDFAEAADGTTNDVSSTSISTTFANQLRLYAPSGEKQKVQNCQDPGATEQGLCATNNVQGRYTHGVKDQACTTATGANNDRFLHVEQHKALRDDDDTDGWSWRTVSRALRDTFPACAMNGGATDCSLGPKQAEPSALTCPLG